MEKINNALIKDYTTYKLEGKIKEIIFPENVEELKNIIQHLENKKYKILGNGSNLIISETYDGVFIKLKNFNELKIEKNIVTVGAGYSVPALARICAKKGLSGLEFASSIPASVGGAVYMNAGAYGKEIKDILKSVTILDEDLNVKVLTKKDLNASYRDSVFKHNKYICLEACFELTESNPEEILKEIEEIAKIRKEKQPLEYPSAGSVFKNPEGYSAGRLIEKAGLKGTRIGGAEVSQKHANFIVNVGGATANDVIELIEKVKEEIKKQDGIKLNPEQEIVK